jgi:hypothetical protein
MQPEHVELPALLPDFTTAGAEFLPVDNLAFCGVNAIHRLQVRIRQHHELYEPFIYTPTHFINDELCMVHSVRVFSLGNSRALWPQQYQPQFVTPSPPQRMSSLQRAISSMSPSSMVPSATASREPDARGKVYDVSFGAVGDAAYRPRMLLFNLDVDAIRPCSMQSVKKYRREKRQGRTSPASPVGRASPRNASPPFSPSPSPSQDREASERQMRLASDSRCLTSVLPITERGWIEFDLAVKKYHLGVLQHQQRSQSPNDSFGSCLARHDALVSAHRNLAKTHLGLLESSAAWHWPINSGRERTYANTPVPDVNQAFTFNLDQDSEAPPTHKSVALRAIYQSFLHWNLGCNGINDVANDDPETDNLRRLRIFRDLALGLSIAPNPSPSEMAAEYREFKRKAPWESLFDADAASQWKEVLLHYSSNNATLFEDSPERLLADYSVVTPATVSVTGYEYWCEIEEEYVVVEEEQDEEDEEEDGEDDEQELCSILRRKKQKRGRGGKARKAGF